MLTTETELNKCWLNIGVFGSKNGNYSIRVETRKRTFVHLQLGVSASGYLSAFEYAYFYLSVDSNSRITMDLQAVEGSLGLYVNLRDQNYSENILEWKRPIKEEFTNVSPECMKEKCHCGVCTIVVGVLCLNSTCRYKVTKRENSILEGTPVSDSVQAGSYAYYQYSSRNDTKALLITLTSLNNCNIGLYVSRAPSLPTAQNSTWRFGVLRIVHIA